MSGPGHKVVSGAVEGLLDEAVLRQLLIHVGAEIGPVYGKQGKNYLREKAHAYNRAAGFAPWVVLVDLNHEELCAPPLRRKWLPDPAPLMSFRVAVRAVEAWLMADRIKFAAFLRIAAAKVPACPELLDNPKATVIELARGSRSRAIRADLVPRPESRRVEGPAYSSRLIEFVQERWQPTVALQSSDSLRRCIQRLHAMASRG